VAKLQFSIVVTCFNQKRFIAAAVDSALAQAHPDTEIIVVDDGSVDGSRELLEGYSDVIRLVRFPENRGAIEARNHGAALARGEYLVFLDGDDLFTPWALRVYALAIAGRSPKIVIGCATWFEGDVPPRITERDRPTRIELMDCPTLMAKDRPVWLSASVLVVERQTFNKVGGWTPGIFHMDLYDIAAKLGQVGRTVCVYLPFTALYRVHSENSTQNVKAFVDMALHIVEKENGGQYPRDSSGSLQRQAWFGGMVAFWTKKAARSGLYRAAAALAASGSVMFLAAALRGAFLKVKGPRPLLTLEWPNG
jgi:glycosyltransferase involved in cell wall biosynthesis